MTSKECRIRVPQKGMRKKYEKNTGSQNYKRGDIKKSRMLQHGQDLWGHLI